MYNKWDTQLVNMSCWCLIGHWGSHFKPSIFREKLGSAQSSHTLTVEACQWTGKVLVIHIQQHVIWLGDSFEFTWIFPPKITHTRISCTCAPVWEYMTYMSICVWVVRGQYQVWLTLFSQSLSLNLELVRKPGSPSDWPFSAPCCMGVTYMCMPHHAQIFIWVLKIWS